MRVLCVFLAMLTGAFGQRSSQTGYTTDINGRAVAGPTVTTTKSDSTTTTTEYHSSVNGGRVPLQSTEERVIREDANGRVVERIIRRYDPNGNPAPPEKQRLEERVNADGSKSSTTAVYRADINGRFELAERVTEDGSKAGNTTQTNVTVDRPTLNGTLETVERQVKQETQADSTVKSDATTYRKDPTGRFVETVRVVAESKEQNGQVIRNEAQYERTDGGLQLASQSVARIRKNADGTEVREVDLFRNVPGRVGTTDAPALTERQVIEQRKANGSVVETVSVQRPSISDPNRLSAPQQISEKVCSGKCP